MRYVLPAVFAALSLATPALSQTFLAENRLQVVPLTTTDFEVIEARGEGARGMWCAAADYAQRSGATQLYVKSARGGSVSGAGRTGVVFTTSTASLDVPPSQSVSVSVRIPGQTLRVAHAYQFCYDYLIEQREKRRDRLGLRY